jgi:hypothetical protein
VNAFSNWFSGEQGPFHTGSGPQYITYHQYVGATPNSPEPRSRPLAVDFLAGLRRRFEPPRGFGEARRILARDHIVLVDGDPGSGRSAAARMLLYEYRSLRDGLREVPAEDDEGGVRLDTRTPDRPEGLLLDLSEADRSTWRALGSELPALHVAVSTSGSRLAVVLPAGLHAGALHPDLARLRAVVHRPDAHLVLRGALREVGLGHERDLLEDVERLLRHGPPLQEVVRLAWLIGSEAASGKSEAFADWCRAAVRALTRRPEDVAQQVVSLRDGRLRALLLATAMLHGAPSDAVHEACESLLAAVDHPVDDRPLLDREDLSARFTEIGANSGPQGRVTFTEMDYDLAIRIHFWNNMPGLRRRLGAWVSEAVALEALPSSDRGHLAERFAEQTLRTSGREDFLHYVEAWADHADPRVRPAAAHALTYGSLHPDHGPGLRRELYTWATSPTLTAKRAEVLTEVCSGELAARHPEQAMVRLHHVARRTGRGGTAEARLVHLVLGDRRLHHRMLERLARDLPRAWKADVRLFGVLASPPRLTARPPGRGTSPRALLDAGGVRACLTDCWAALFDHVPAAEWREVSRQWLTAAGNAEPPHREHLLDILVHACLKQPLHLARLYTLALPHPVAPLALRKIDIVQGLEPNRP